ncbi:MAG: transcription antitermination factor NusB [Erysipelotrichaceae bacterium]|nr:transcription antitermination factor NusB [Erysipelotrichaceae bacterium]
MKRRKQREIIMTCIYQYLLLNTDIDTIFEDNLDLNDKDSISFIVSTTINALNNAEEYTEQINHHLKDWTFDRLGYVERAILLMAASEIHEGELDKAIIVNEAVELTKHYCDEEAYKLINGVLDQL